VSALLKSNSQRTPIKNKIHVPVRARSARSCRRWQLPSRQLPVYLHRLKIHFYLPRHNCFEVYPHSPMHPSASSDEPDPALEALAAAHDMNIVHKILMKAASAVHEQVRLHDFCFLHVEPAAD
jgi:hypothetical protein